VLGLDEWRRLFELSDRHGFVIASDECYSEIYFDEAAPPLGALQAAHALGRDDYRAHRDVLQPVEAQQRAGPALRLRRRRRRSHAEEVLALPHLPGLRHEPAVQQPARPPGATRRTCAKTAACIARSSTP
jgi:hypothetical protein